MKIELHFDESIYRKQMKLLYEMGYGRKRTYLKNSNYLGFAFVLLGFLIVLKKRDIGYLFILLGSINLISYYHFYFKQKKVIQKYEAEQLEIINLLTENPNVVFEFNEEGLSYSDYKENLKVGWDEFNTFIEKDENIFLITKTFRPFAVGKSEVGSKTYYQIKNFVESKMEKTSR